MTKEEIQKRIEFIVSKDGDDEVQHAREDSLRREFLRFIADNSPEYGELANLVLSTDTLEFARWCA